MNSQLRNKLIFTGILTALLLFAYSNHFQNGFYFDDAHTISKNTEIRDIKNIPNFFKDGRTFSSLPANQSYRPVVTTLNAVDYWLGGGLNPFYFHLSIFVSYIALLILLFFMVRHLFRKMSDDPWNGWYSLMITGFYAMHTANAETINYIISRSDSFSTLMIVAATLIYFKADGRRRLWSLVPIFIGMLTKPTTLMFIPIVLLYEVLFNEGITVENNRFKIRIPGSKVTLLIFLFIGSFLFFAFTEYMTPETWVSGGTSRFHYMLTQPYVIASYFFTFILPNNLSADTDWKLVTSIADTNVLYGLLFLLTVFYIMYITWRSEKWRPVCFGLGWFLFALFPTSGIIPFSEVKNDHRIFFPYIGLAIAFGWPLVLLAKRYRDRISMTSSTKVALFAVYFLLIGLHVYGVRTRNEVWSSSEKLWHDVTLKSPKNPRGLMNYGVALMAKADYTGAKEYFERALEMWPYYSYLHINLGVLHNELTDFEKAESHYQKALKYGERNPDCYYYYAKYLLDNSRLDEAEKYIKKGIKVSPNHIHLNAQSERLKKMKDSDFTEGTNSLDNLDIPSLLQLSLQFYNSGEYYHSIRMANRILQIDSTSSAAWNNICVSHNMLGNWNEAINACNKALQFQPDYELARNNLKWAIDESNKAKE
ncbi:MAG: tetratricopeptide repeat protein [Bacteroidetes bacterium]|nr:tetratricopeptide repeat protein [Bacteroidota bacterium]